MKHWDEKIVAMMNGMTNPMCLKMDMDIFQKNQTWT